jgi:hypothetical protein
MTDLAGHWHLWLEFNVCLRVFLLRIHFGLRRKKPASRQAFWLTDVDPSAFGGIQIHRTNPRAVQVRARIDWLTTDTNLVMQVWSGRIASRTDRAQQRARANIIANRNVHPREVPKQRAVAHPHPA